MGDQLRGPATSIGEWLAMRRQHEPDVQLTHTAERVKVVRYRIRHLVGEVDVRCDRGQQVVAGDQYLVCGPVEAYVAGSVPGGHQHLPVAESIALVDRLYLRRAVGELVVTGQELQHLRGDLAAGSKPVQRGRRSVLFGESELGPDVRVSQCDVPIAARE